MQVNNLSLRNNLFVVPIQDNDKYIVYAPLQGYSFFCNAKDAFELNEYISKGQIPHNKNLAAYISDQSQKYVSKHRSLQV